MHSLSRKFILHVEKKVHFFHEKGQLGLFLAMQAGHEGELRENDRDVEREHPAGLLGASHGQVCRQQLQQEETVCHRWVEPSVT